MNKRIIACVIIQSGDKILLGQKEKGRPPYPDVWHTLGGGVRDLKLAEKLLQDNQLNNKYFIEEVEREIKEESNLEIKDVINICPKYRKKPREAITEDRNGIKTQYIFLEYLCKLNSDIKQARPGDDIAELQWVLKRDLKNTQLTPPSLQMYKELGWI